jgi:hypothetical protein
VTVSDCDERGTSEEQKRTSDTVTVRDNPALNRYEIYSDDQRVGLSEYKLHGSVLTLLHTEVDPAFGGRGLGKRLVEGALADARQRGLAVRPMCPYVRKVIADNLQTYLDLVPESERARFELSQAPSD